MTIWYTYLYKKLKTWSIPWIILGVFLVPSFGFAEDDCDRIDVPIRWWMFSSFLPVEDVEIARKNLTSYCCVERRELFGFDDFKQWGKCSQLTVWAESLYWYDHLVDVWLRRLDAESLYSGMSVDPLWSWWRHFITGTGMKTPEIFTNVYTWYWTQSWPYLFAYYTWGFIFDSLVDITARKDYFTLYDKYINYCFVAMMMYHRWLWLRDVIIDQGKNSGYYGRCLSMVKSRVRQETSLAVMISQYNSARMLVESLSSYTDQFVQNRLMGLQDKILGISSLFAILANQAPLSADCMK
jgi:hypothetical protein